MGRASVYFLAVVGLSYFIGKFLGVPFPINWQGAFTILGILIVASPILSLLIERDIQSLRYLNILYLTFHTIGSLICLWAFIFMIRELTDPEKIGQGLSIIGITIFCQILIGEAFIRFLVFLHSGNTSDAAKLKPPMASILFAFCSLGSLAYILNGISGT